VDHTSLPFLLFSPKLTEFNSYRAQQVLFSHANQSRHFVALRPFTSLPFLFPFQFTPLLPTSLGSTTPIGHSHTTPFAHPNLFCAARPRLGAPQRRDPAAALWPRKHIRLLGNFSTHTLSAPSPFSPHYTSLADELCYPNQPPPCFLLFRVSFIGCLILYYFLYPCLFFPHSPTLSPYFHLSSCQHHPRQWYFKSPPFAQPYFNSVVAAPPFFSLFPFLLLSLVFPVDATTR